MGTWGTGILQNDMVCDIQGTFKDYLKDRKSISEITSLLREQFSDVLNDSDEAPLFWIAIADMQWKYGELDSNVLKKVFEIINSDMGMENWGVPSDKLYQQRKSKLREFYNKIAQPNIKPLRPPKRIIRKPHFEVGDCLSVLLDNGKYGAGLVLANDTTNPEYPAELIGDIDYMEDAPPVLDVFMQRKWLKVTHHNWDGKLNLLWYGSAGFKKIKSRITVIGNISILPNDPRESPWYGGWHTFAKQIIYQRDWNREQGNRK